MSTFRYRVVVSVSAALAQLAAGIAGGNTPGFAQSLTDSPDSQTVSAFTRLQPHLPSSEALANGNNEPVNRQEEVAASDPKTKTPRLVTALPLLSHSSPPTTASQPEGVSPNATPLGEDAGASKQTSDLTPNRSASMGEVKGEQGREEIKADPSNTPLRPNVTAQRITPLQPPEQFPPDSPALNAPLPDYLRPNPNPLLFPTRPEEVNIDVVQPLTLEQALELARRNNRDLQVALLQLERAQAALREARAALFPRVDLRVDAAGGQSAQAEINLERQRQLNPEADLEAEAQFSIDGNLSITYDIFTAGRRDAQIEAAQEQVRFNQLEVERLSEQTRFNVADAYYDLQQADEQIRISEAAVRNAQRSLEDALGLESAGLGTRFDVLRAQVQLANETQNLIRSRAQQQVNRRQIAQILSLPPSVNVTAADPVEIAGLWDLTLEQSIVEAFQRRAELQQQLVQRNINRQQRRIVQAEQRPQVNLFANYNLLEVLNDGFGLADGYSVGARLQWNLFNGGATQARVRQEEADIAIAETQFANQRNQIRFQVEQAYFTLISNLENIQTASVALEQAREALRLARLRFQAGVGTQTEVIDAETELTRAEGNRLRAIIDYNRALAALQRAISNLADASPAIAP